ncbi:MAG: hypothetical protein JWL76_2273 [Thermoleophilia bacterium]|nr:hypothetical protein [Thermoleophilia bacterium]
MGKSSTRLLDRQIEAFERVYPTCEYAGWFVCPQCLNAISLEAIAEDPGCVSIEHVPPQSVRGRALVLTCRRCNNTAGHELETHLAKADAVARGEEPVGVGYLHLDGMRLPVRECLDQDSGIRLDVNLGVGRPNDRARIRKLIDDAMAAGGEPAITGSYRPGPRRWSLACANVARLRTAYLYAFAQYGYSYVIDRRLDIVRETIIEHAHKGIPASMIVDIDDVDTENKLIEVVEPKAYRCLAVRIGDAAIFLPAPRPLSREGIYSVTQRLAKRGRGFAWRQGRIIDLPTRQVFAHDTTERIRAA